LQQSFLQQSFSENFTMNEITIMNDLPWMKSFFADDDGGSGWVNQSYGQMCNEYFLFSKGGGGVVRGEWV
jgi:hypothetical protein